MAIAVRMTLSPMTGEPNLLLFINQNVLCMKTPHLVLATFVAMLALYSCQQDVVSIDNPAVSDQHKVELRCCEDLPPMAEDPIFIDMVNQFFVGLTDPGQTLWSMIDSNYLSLVLANLEECLEEEADHVVCADSLLYWLSVKGFLAWYHNLGEGSNQLYETYGQDDPEGFDRLLSEAFDTLLSERFEVSEEMRQVPCYEAYQREIFFAITELVAEVALDPFAIPRFIRDMEAALYDYCNCLYNNYNYNC